MLTLKRGRYKVQVLDRDTGIESWVTVEADGKAEALELVAEMGEIVGRAVLDEVVEVPDPEYAPEPSTEPRPVRTGPTP